MQSYLNWYFLKMVYFLIIGEVVTFAKSVFIRICNASAYYTSWIRLEQFHSNFSYHVQTYFLLLFYLHHLLLQFIVHLNGASSEFKFHSILYHFHFWAQSYKKLPCVKHQISVCFIISHNLIYSVFLQFEWHPPAVGEGFDTQLGAAAADVACHGFHPKVVLDHHR